MREDPSHEISENLHFMKITFINFYDTHKCSRDVIFNVMQLTCHNHSTYEALVDITNDPQKYSLIMVIHKFYLLKIGMYKCNINSL